MLVVPVPLGEEADSFNYCSRTAPWPFLVCSFDRYMQFTPEQRQGRGRWTSPLHHKKSECNF